MKGLQSGLGLAQFLPNFVEIESGPWHLGFKPNRLIELQGRLAKESFGLIFQRGSRGHRLIGQIEEPDPPMEVLFVGVVGGFGNFQKSAMGMKQYPIWLGLFLGLGKEPIQLPPCIGHPSQTDQQFAIVLAHGKVGWLTIKVAFQGVRRLFFLPLLEKGRGKT